jgi:Outer membrane protein
LFGSLLNAKRKAKTALEQSEACRQAVQTSLIASIANSYYTLLMLDEQLEISEVTAGSWQESVRVMSEMKEAAMTNEAAVSQAEAGYRSVEAGILDLKRQIRETENALCVMLGTTPGKIERNKLEDITVPERLSSGVPLQLLSNRPDVKQAETALAIAYYGTNAARSAFYPKITLNGSAGWTNSVGETILNPGKFLVSAIGSLVQPLFNKGKNIANLKIAKAQQEEALLSFKQSLLNAGSEVSDALYLFQSAGEKEEQRTIQVKALENSVRSTHELFRLGTSTYLEVLTAQQGLFDAQISQVGDRFEQLQAVINLYHALGGGRDEKQPAGHRLQG